MKIKNMGPQTASAMQSGRHRSIFQGQPENEPAPQNNHEIPETPDLRGRAFMNTMEKPDLRGKAFATLQDYSDYLHGCYVQILSTNTLTILAHTAQLEANLGPT